MPGIDAKTIIQSLNNLFSGDPEQSQLENALKIPRNSAHSEAKEVPQDFVF